MTLMRSSKEASLHGVTRQDDKACQREFFLCLGQALQNPAPRLDNGIDLEDRASSAHRIEGGNDARLLRTSRGTGTISNLVESLLKL